MWYGMVQEAQGGVRIKKLFRMKIKKHLGQQEAGPTATIIISKLLWLASKPTG